MDMLSPPLTELLFLNNYYLNASPPFHTFFMEMHNFSEAATLFLLSAVTNNQTESSRESARFVG